MILPGASLHPARRLPQITAFDKVRAFTKLDQFVDAYLLTTRFIDVKVLEAISKSNIASNNKQLMSIQTSLESIREEYNIGTKTITDLIDAESELLTVNVNYHSSKKDMILNYFNIMALEGSLISAFENFLPSYN